MRNEQAKTIDFSKFSKNMGVLRATTGWSAREASKAAGLRNLSRWECIEYGRGTPNLEDVVSICKLVNTPMDDMLNKTAKVVVHFF